MKRKLMITGGLAGFSLGILGGVIAEGSSWPAILPRASAAALGTGLLFRWWGGVLIKCVSDARAEAHAPDRLASAHPLPTKH